MPAHCRRPDGVRMREGDVVAARYRVVRRAASGGMGTVYEALDTTAGVTVALKTLRVDPRGERTRGESRLVREAEALAEVHHPAVVRYLDHGVAPDFGPFLVMAWVAGGETLEQRLASRGITPADAIQLAARLASGLAAVHARGLVHRDLKPSNVMFPEGRLGEATLVDFGVARMVPTASAPTATADPIVTPPPMPPQPLPNPPPAAPPSHA